jgi:methylase of polypeptide subunit release factors
LDERKDARDIATVEALYNQLAELERQHINGIWARIIKNAFAPLFQSPFDLVAGNPPWINWESLPDDYRQQTAPLWQTYGLFSHTGLRARLGSAKDDLSVLMLYVAADRYLKPNGKLGFVITQTIFKTEGGGAGFAVCSWTSENRCEFCRSMIFPKSNVLKAQLIEPLS